MDPFENNTDSAGAITRAAAQYNRTGWYTYLKGITRPGDIEPLNTYYYKFSHKNYYSVTATIPINSANHYLPRIGSGQATIYIYAQVADYNNPGTYCEFGICFDSNLGWQACATAQVNWDGRLPFTTNFGGSKILIPATSRSFGWWYDDSAKQFNMKIDNVHYLTYYLPISTGSARILTATSLCTPSANINTTSAYFNNVQWQNCQIGDYYGAYSPFLSNSSATERSLLNNKLSFEKSGSTETLWLNQ